MSTGLRVTVDLTAPMGLFRPLIGALGGPRFGATLLRGLHNVCGAEHLAIYDFSAGQLRDVTTAGPAASTVAARLARLYASGGYWRRDMGVEALLGAGVGGLPRIFRYDPERMDAVELRDRIYRPNGVSERLLLGTSFKTGEAALSLIRTRSGGAFQPDEVTALLGIAEPLLAILNRHIVLCDEQRSVAAVLTSVSEIERNLGSLRPRLSGREAQVCARMLHGMTTTGIALDLSVGEQTVITYRKRSFRRLNISCQRDLLIWYLDHWRLVRTDDADAI